MRLTAIFREHNRSFQELGAFRSGESRLSVRRTGAQAGPAAEPRVRHLVFGKLFCCSGNQCAAGTSANQRR